MMSLYPCAIHHQSTAKYYWHCTYFIFTENIWIPLTSEAVLEILNVLLSWEKRKGHQNELWNLQNEFSAILCKLGESVKFLVLFHSIQSSGDSNLEMLHLQYYLSVRIISLLPRSVNNHKQSFFLVYGGTIIMQA